MAARAPRSASRGPARLVRETLAPGHSGRAGGGDSGKGAEARCGAARQARAGYWEARRGRAVALSCGHPHRSRAAEGNEPRPQQDSPPPWQPTGATHTLCPPHTARPAAPRAHHPQFSFCCCSQRLLPTERGATSALHTCPPTPSPASRARTHADTHRDTEAPCVRAHTRAHGCCLSPSCHLALPSLCSTHILRCICLPRVSETSFSQTAPH